MRFKTFENFDWDEDEEGEIFLYYGDDAPTSWFYLVDSIKDGLLDEKFGIDDDIIEKIGQSCFDVEYMTDDDLCDIIFDDFQNSLQKVFQYLIENDIIDEYVSVRIEGYDEDGDECEFSYEPSEEDEHNNKVRKTGKKYNL